ncbi:hypothetical protein BKA82DRAFT_4361900 [Pisolithus tinctorius]|nr:hypothetical protein BKA82DRAFT_4361900 [Pisolithus tinctorius]
MLTRSHTCFPSPLSTLHSPLSSLILRQGNCLAWSLRESSWYGLAVGRADETPSHGGATSYSATRGVEDCQLSLATLESIFYFPKETQLFTLPAGTLIGFLLLTFLLSWLRQRSLRYLSRPMVFRGYPQLHLVHLRQDSVHFSRWDANRVSLARFLTFLVNAAFSPLSIKADGLPWLPPVPSSPSNTRVFSICPPGLSCSLSYFHGQRYVLFDIYYARGTFGASPTKGQGLGALRSSQRLGAFESHLGMDIP